MIEGPYIAEVASLIGDPARANMLTALMDGRALTATELSYCAGITPQTASSHLRKMETSGLLTQEKQGRHRYYRLSGKEVAEALEALMVLSSTATPRIRPTGPRDDAMRRARTCYDHLAGALGVAVTDALCDAGCLAVNDKDFRVDGAASELLDRLGINLEDLTARKRPLARQCLDWSERRPHLAGSLGAEILNRMLEKGWVKRAAGSRTVTLTPQGRVGLTNDLGLSAELVETL